MWTYEYIPCQNGHQFTWASDGAAEVPEGLPCECGHTTAHWEQCPHCGQKRLIAKCIEQPS